MSRVKQPRRRLVGCLVGALSLLIVGGVVFVTPRALASHGCQGMLTAPRSGSQSVYRVPWEHLRWLHWAGEAATMEQVLRLFRDGTPDALQTAFLIVKFWALVRDGNEADGELIPIEIPGLEAAQEEIMAALHGDNPEAVKGAIWALACFADPRPFLADVEKLRADPRFAGDVQIFQITLFLNDKRASLRKSAP